MPLQAITASDLNSISVTDWLLGVEQTDAPKRDLASMECADSTGDCELAERSPSPTKRRRLGGPTTASSPSVIRSGSGRLPAFSQASSVTRTRTRTPSPTKTGDRVKRVNLEFTKPRFFLGLHDTDFGGDDDDDDDDLDRVSDIILSTLPMPDTIPPTIVSLISLLAEHTNTPASIPADLASPLAKLTRNIEPVPPDAYGPSRFPSSIASSTLLAYAKSIYITASRNFRKHESESAWYPVVRSILTGPTTSFPKTRPTFFTVEESQTILLHSELLPTLDGYAIPSVKVDHLLQFNREHLNVGKGVLDGLFEEEPGLWISAFNDAVAGKDFTAGVVEVKSMGGDYEEGVYQFCVTAAAILERLRILKEAIEGGVDGEVPDEDGEGEMPVVGWVVHGHFWYLHMAYRRPDGNVRVIGPFQSGNTATYVGIFRLMSIIRSFKKWAKDKYWPWLKGVAERRRLAIRRNKG